MTHINQRRDTEAQWAFENPVLHQGELGWESDTRQAKLGDGVTPWLDLPYAVATPSIAAGVIGEQINLGNRSGSITWASVIADPLRYVNADIRMNLTGNITFNSAIPAGLLDGTRFRVMLIQNATGGNTTTLVSTYYFNPDLPALISTSPSTRTILEFARIAGTWAVTLWGTGMN